tara:strand:- start:288 stop:530 length:243 start_codon:yes stop_codon:yes gene_type:complete
MNNLNRLGSARVLRYTTGSVGYWLFRRLCIVHNINLESIAAIRINDDADHWAIYVKPNVDVLPFVDQPILNFYSTRAIGA